MARSENDRCHFLRGPREYPRDHPIAVHTFAAGAVSVDHYPMEEFLKQEFELADAGSGFRWLHVPVNNMDWVEKCAAKCAPQLSGMGERTWALKLRPAPQQIIKPLHSRYMEPSCSACDNVALNGDKFATAMDLGMGMSLSIPSFAEEDQKSGCTQQPLLSLYLPYMNWDSYGDFCSLREAYTDGQPARPDDSTRVKIEHDLARYLHGDRPLHPRRSLDQFYYSSLSDARARDKDQTISKWTGKYLEEEGRTAAVKDSLMIMVDQLWCWVLDEKNILSFFPSGDTQYHDRDFTDLYHNIREHCSSCETVWDLYSTLVKEATTYLFTQENRKFMDLIEIYRWVTGKKVAHQTSYFQEFHHPEPHRFLSSTALDDRRELKLILDVADIIDELKMIRHLIEKQREVLKALILALRKFNASSDNQTHGEQHIFVRNNTYNAPSTTIIAVQNHEGITDLAESSKALAQGIAVPARNSVVFAEEVLVFLLAEIDAIKKDAEYAHKMLLDLLDLRQKAAALAEARSTTQQGRAIMLFTIVTIIFLPLSFFTSFFGQNVSEITGDESNPTTWDLWKIGTPISVVVILSALLIGFCITDPKSHLLFWRDDRYRQWRSLLP